MMPGETQASKPDGLTLYLKTPPLIRRLGCWFYEGILLFAVVFMAGYLFSTLTQTRHGLQHRLGQQLFIFGVLGYYFTWFWHKGQTLAMKTWHIRITDPQGQAVSQLRALARYLLCWIWFVPPLALIWGLDLPLGSGSVLILGWVVIYAILSRFHPQRQFWHDVWAGTRLVDVRP